MSDYVDTWYDSDSSFILKLTRDSVLIEGVDKADKGREAWIPRYCAVVEEEQLFKIYRDEQVGL